MILPNYAASSTYRIFTAYTPKKAGIILRYSLPSLPLLVVLPVVSPGRSVKELYDTSLDYGRVCRGQSSHEVPVVRNHDNGTLPSLKKNITGDNTTARAIKIIITTSALPDTNSTVQRVMGGQLHCRSWEA